MHDGVFSTSRSSSEADDVRQFYKGRIQHYTSEIERLNQRISELEQEKQKQLKLLNWIISYWESHSNKSIATDFFTALQNVIKVIN